MWRALRAPFSWFQGKVRVAPILWCAFEHSVPNELEPLVGREAALLGWSGYARAGDSHCAGGTCSPVAGVPREGLAAATVCRSIREPTWMGAVG